MAGSAVTGVECEKCGVEVRTGSAFCYNCGAPVGGDNGTAAASNADRSGGLSAPAIPMPAEPPPEIKVPPPADKPAKPRLDEAKLEPAPPAPPVRKRGRRPRPEPRLVEVVWEERGQSWGFIVGAIVLVSIALAIVLLAVYLK